MAVTTQAPDRNRVFKIPARIAKLAESTRYNPTGEAWQGGPFNHHSTDPLYDSYDVVEDRGAWLAEISGAILAEEALADHPDLGYLRAVFGWALGQLSGQPDDHDYRERGCSDFYAVLQYAFEEAIAKAARATGTLAVRQRGSIPITAAVVER